MNGVSNSEFADAVRLPDHSQAVDRVKEIVIRHLASTDDRAAIHKTSYFNHSFVPDLVLNWRNDKEERYVFLRPEATRANLLQDMQLTQDIHPIYYSLTDIEQTLDEENEAEVQSASRETNSLVTDSRGLDSLVTNRRESPVISLATSAVLQGARGIFDEDRATSVSRALVDGIDAAAAINATDTDKASQTILEAFDPKRSSRLNRLLQAIWVGSGGSATDFPGSVDLSAGLDEGSISYLLEIDLIDDQNFWRRIGRQLTLELLGRITVRRPSPNFQMLIRSNLDVLYGRTCRVASTNLTLPNIDDEDTEEGNIDKFEWDVVQGNLALRGQEFIAYIAEHKSRLGYPEVTAPRTRFEDLASRVATHRIPIAELTLSSEGRTVSYSSESEIDPVRETRLRAISRALGASASVQSVVALMPGHSPLTCDFRTSTTSGKTSALYPIVDLIRTSVTLLTNLSESDRANLEAIVTLSKFDDQTTLF